MINIPLAFSMLYEVLVMSNWTSNAFNFDSFCSGGVDQRTRSYSFNILLGALKGNFLKGPNIDVALQFSPYQTDNRGFGKGWSLNIPCFDIINKQLYLANGQSYRAEVKPDGRIDIRYKKLSDFYISSNSNGYEIVYRNGRRDYLSAEGYLTKIVQADGHSMNFKWGAKTNNIRNLQSIWDDSGSIDAPLFRIDYISQSSINVVSYISHTHQATLRLQLTNGKLIKCVLPDAAGEFGFGYQDINAYTVISQVTHPCGMTEQLTHSATVQYGIQVNSSIILPAVTLHKITTGNSPVQEIIYQRVGTDTRNFMGYGVAGGDLAEGIDNLLERGRPYVYQVEKVEGGTIKSVQTYNQFHLLTEESRAIGSTVVFRRKLSYPALENQPFSDQPAQYSLINKEDLTWYNDNSNYTKTRVWNYDQFGNLLVFIDENGVSESYEYYSIDGEANSENGDFGCPPSSSGMINFVKSRLLSSGSESRRIIYAYQAIKGLEDQDYIVLSREHAAPCFSVDYSYHIEKSQLVSYTRLAAVTCNIFNSTQVYPSTSQYEYVLNGDIIEEHQELICHDGSKTNVIVGHYKDLGALALHIDPDAVRCSFIYDALGRPIEERIEGGATRTYQYFLDQSAKQQTIVVTDCKGNKCTQSYDGLGKEVKAWLEDTLLWHKEYDKFGHLSKRSLFDVLPGKEPEALVSVALIESYEYDDWGQRKATVLPNGKRFIEFYDLAKSQKTEGIEGLPLSISTLNNRGLEEKKEQGNAVWLYEYDAWGRLIKETNPLQYSKQYEYDVFDRVVKITQENNDIQNISYAPFTDQSQVTKLVVGGRTVGARDLDGLGRPVALYRGSRNAPNLTWAYSDASSTPTTESSLMQANRTFTRDKELGVVINKKAGDQETSFIFDPMSGLPTGSSNNNGHSHQIQYMLTGLPHVEYIGEQQRQYNYSTGGVISSIVGDGIVRHFGYDQLGRLVRISSGAANIEYVYDDFDRVILETITSGMNVQTTDIEWDDFNREVSRHVALNGSYVFSQNQAYNDIGLLISRTKSYTGFSSMTENYEYNPVMQLSKVIFSGYLPQSEWGAPMLSIEWRYDALGNIQTQECLTNNGNDVAQYHYEAEDPCQLTRITHTHPLMPSEKHIIYDLNGNVIEDIDGRQLHYDAFDKLIQVTSGETTWSYEYDSNERLSIQRSGADIRRFGYLWEELVTVEENGKLKHYIYDDGNPKWLEDDASISMFAVDMNGSVVALNNNGIVDFMYRYSPYGQREQLEKNNV